MEIYLYDITGFWVSKLKKKKTCKVEVKRKSVMERFFFFKWNLLLCSVKAEKVNLIFFFSSIIQSSCVRLYRFIRDVDDELQKRNHVRINVFTHYYIIHLQRVGQ